MPRNSDKAAINNPKYDKRVKLTDEAKERIREEYATGNISMRGLAKKYNVSRRLIDFIINPERQERARQQFLERQREGRYYDKEKHNEYMRRHRDHKKELWSKGLINDEKEK